MGDKSNILGSLMPCLRNDDKENASMRFTTMDNSRINDKKRPTSGGKQHKLKQRFTVIKKLGKGTYGKVQLAINKETGQEVAIKTIKKTKIENEQDLQRVRREIQIMSSIEHPHIVHIYEVFENKDKIVLVMQYAPGGELYEYVSQSKLLDDCEARRLFRQIATAIYYCHQNKICHRDLKLENILLDEKNNAKLADFGLSNVFNKQRQLKTFCGSPLYASPEIVQGSPYEGPEVDCWSLGVLLYTLVYGAMPFDGTNFRRLVKQISEACYLEPKQKSGASPLIKRLLCADPLKRANILDICSDPWVNGLSEQQQQLVYSHNSLLKVAQDMANLTPVRFDILLALDPTCADPEQVQVEPPAQIVAEQEALLMEVEAPVASFVVRDLEAEEAQEEAELEVDQLCSTTAKEEVISEVEDTDKREEAVIETKEDQVLPAPETTDLVEPIDLVEPTDPVEVKNALEEVKMDVDLTAQSAEPIEEPLVKEEEPQTQPEQEEKPKKVKKKIVIVKRKKKVVKKEENESEEKSEEKENGAEQVKQKPIKTIKSAKGPGKVKIPDTFQPSQEETPQVELARLEVRRPSALVVDVSQKLLQQLQNDFEANSKPDQSELMGVRVSDKKSEFERRASLAVEQLQSFKSVSPTELLEPIRIESQNESLRVLDEILESFVEPVERLKPLQVDSLKKFSDSLETLKPAEEPVRSSLVIKLAEDSVRPQSPVGPAPITRSYKKVTFTKEGACVTETGKIYSQQSTDGSVRRIERKSKVTHYPASENEIGWPQHRPFERLIMAHDKEDEFRLHNSLFSRNSGPRLTSSASSNSSGSSDAFEDIFEHWTGAISMFNQDKSGLFAERRFPKSGRIRSRCESAELRAPSEGETPERAASALGTASEHGDDLLRELELEHQRIRERLAKHHKQIWKGSTPNLLNSSSLSGQGWIAKQRPVAQQVIVDSPVEQVAQLGELNKLLEQSQSSSSFLRQSSNQSKRILERPPSAKLPPKCTSRATIVLSSSNEKPSASLIELKRTSSSTSRQIGQRNEHVQSWLQQSSSSSIRDTSKSDPFAELFKSLESSQVSAHEEKSPDLDLLKGLWPKEESSATSSSTKVSSLVKQVDPSTSSFSLRRLVEQSECSFSRMQTKPQEEVEDNELDSRSSSSLLDQLKSRGYRSMMNQRLVNEAPLLLTKERSSKEMLSQSEKVSKLHQEVVTSFTSCTVEKEEEPVNESSESPTKEPIDDEEEEDEDIRETKANMRSYLKRVKETELFLKSMEEEEETLERQRKQLFLFNNLMLSSKLNSFKNDHSGARSAPIRTYNAHDDGASSSNNGFIKYTIPSRQSYLPSRAFNTSANLQETDLTKYDAQAEFRARRSRSQLADQFQSRPVRPLSANYDQYLRNKQRSVSQLRYQPTFRLLNSDQSCEPNVSEYRTAFRAPSESLPITSNCSSPLIDAELDSDDGMSNYRVSSYVPNGAWKQPNEDTAASRTRRNSLQSDPIDQEPARRKLSLVGDSTSELESGSRLSQLEQRIAENRKRREELLSGRSSPRPAECKSPSRVREQESASSKTLARPSRLESMEARIKRRSYCASIHSKASDSLAQSLERWRPSGQVSSPRNSSAGLDYSLLSQLTNRSKNDQQSD